MAVVFNSPITRGQDNGGDVAWSAFNWENQRATVAFRYQTGKLEIFVYDGTEALALRTRVAQLGGLRLALEQDLIGQGKIPPGTAA